MSSGAFAILLIVGIVLFAFGGSYLAMGLMAVGGIGLVISAFAGKK